MPKTHQYNTAIRWTGNTGNGTKSYASYQRDHTISVANKPEILASSDPSFRGDKSRYNPEELFVSSLSSCHMLWYLHLCSEEGIIVTDYADYAKGIMQEDETGSGHFVEVTLHPEVIITNEDQINLANELHNKAHEFCFIANSCNFPIKTSPVCRVENTAAKTI
jgi:organic hydroperoxide reductase OsmC/OhrA